MSEKVFCSLFPFFFMSKWTQSNRLNPKAIVLYRFGVKFFLKKNNIY